MGEGFICIDPVPVSPMLCIMVEKNFLGKGFMAKRGHL